MNNLVIQIGQVKKGNYMGIHYCNAENSYISIHWRQGFGNFPAILLCEVGINLHGMVSRFEKSWQSLLCVFDQILS